MFTGPRMIEQMTEPPLELPRDEAMRRLEGWLIGEDHQTTCAVALIAPEAYDYREAAIEHVYQSAAKVDGLSRDDLRVAGNTIDGVAINQATSQRMMTLTIASLAICVSLMYVAFRSVLLTWFVFCTAVLSERLSFAWMFYLGATPDSVSLMVPAVVLAISAGVHLINYFRDEVALHGLPGAAEKAVRHAWRPCSLAAFTTALGMGSLLVSSLIPVSRFGTYAALGTLSALALLFTAIPAALVLTPPRAWARKVYKSHRPDRLAPYWKQMCGLVVRFPNLVAGVGVLLLVVGVAGAARVRVTARLHDMLSANNPVVQDYAWLEERVGPLVPLEIVVRMPAENELSWLDRMRLVETLHREVRSLSGVERTLSAVTFAPPLPQGVRGIKAITERSIFNRHMDKHAEDLAQLGFRRVHAGEELWRISVGANASDATLQFSEVLERISNTIDPQLNAVSEQLGVPIEALYSGGMPLVQKAQQQLLKDMIDSFVMALGIITIVMILLLRNPVGGMLAMIPNVLPAVIVFGAMGWLGPAIEVGSMMTASVALGIAVDDTLHFITWFQRGMRRTNERRRAVMFAYRRCATAMTQTSLICGLGLVVFAASPFAPISRFGFMMAAMLAAALLSDLLILPAILLGPLGITFVPRRRAVASTEIKTLDAEPQIVGQSNP
ncbi:MAG: MMPL family transporter [Pirellulaceae bacterium]